MPFDMAAALERTGGDRALFQELAGLFCRGCPQQMAEVQNAIAQKDAQRLKAAAHALKGAVGSFGPSRAFDAVLRLETMGRNGDLTGAPEIYESLRQEMTLLVSHLESVV